MVNIIYQNDGSIRLTQLVPTTIYNLTDLKFYIPFSNDVSSLFCIVKNNTDKDAIKLVSTPSDNKSYTCYTFSQDCKLSVESGDLTLCLFGLNADKSTLLSNEFNVKINVDEFNTYNQLYAITQVNSDIANYYNKINELTKMNIDLFSKIQELTGGVK